MVILVDLVLELAPDPSHPEMWGRSVQDQNPTTCNFDFFKCMGVESSRIRRGRESSNAKTEEIVRLVG